MDTLLLTEIKTNQSGTVKEVLGGIEARRRLEYMGIRPGEKITKIGAHFWRGPVTVLIGKAKVAIGHGMARKIMVEVK
jgi:ferrous iron transport protein A